ncbi:exosortase B [Methylobacillus arboreus]|uniref:exosortase B n=1 Tax=Methylobacillus arboreus TaxID=755170 RepID=UPI001E5544E3|nr:exosortase B [Methylobacillus arboreus]MCB5189215.1 exosortase B [Methylobacillus arboreus]
MFKNTSLVDGLKAHWLLWVGILVLYVPTFINLVTTVWTSEDQAHGPLILLVVGYLVWTQKEFIFSKESRKTSPVLGWLLIAIGLCAYILGRSQDIVILDLGSQIPIIIGLLLIYFGYKGVRTFWFPIFFLIFMIPLPGVLVDAVTLPMKIAVSYVAEDILYFFNYPISRTGVILQIGQYQLLVADACAGLHTLISLEALGLLYLNIVKHDSLLRNIALATLIIPISFTANVIRVIVLTLVTYYFGDAVGQGFVHGFAGILLFVVALTLIISVDSLLQFFVARRIKNKHGADLQRG